ncbi:polysaccharide pyruvyl transferase family protein [Agrococcus sp. Ld7]|uniref:polysaccharide pyruvyl transferase family protein n=1 Tax=Agrococcus sp. Ld7 TaxID=649148 RepID=UPI003869DECF
MNTSTASTCATYWWRRPDGLLNFGDDLTPFLIEELFPNLTPHWADVENADLVGIGSVLQQFKQPRRTPLECWGAGYIAADSWAMHDRTRFHAVRGELTLAKLQPAQQRGVVLGDPGLLMGLLFNANEIETDYELGVIPHYVDAGLPAVSELRSSAHVSVIDVAAPVEDVVRSIARCRRVISSSLHGLVVSDALRIPNLWVKLSNDVAGDGFKFADYYSALGREAHAIPIAPTPGLVQLIDERYRPIDALEEMQTALLGAFPREVAH